MNIEATGKLISEQRKRLGITQQQLGERLGVTNTAVSKWERGLSYPDVSLLPALANELNVTVSEIIYGSKNAEQENFESDVTAKEVIDIADKQIKKDRKKFKKIIVAFSVILTVVILAFVTTVLVMSFSFWDHTKWQDEATAKSYFDESSLTLPVKVRAGNPDAYYGESFIVIKDIKIPHNEVIGKIKDIAKRDGKETVDLGTGCLIVDRENIGNGYVFIWDRPARSNYLYFYSAGALLKNGREDEGMPIAFPIYLLDENVYNSIYENIEYRFGYGQDVTEEIKNRYIRQFIDFYNLIGGYEASLSDDNKTLTVTELKTGKTVTLNFDAVSGFGTVKIRT